MGPIERSEAFWDTFGTVTSESKVDKSDNSKSDVYTSVEGTGGNVGDDNDDEEDDNDQPSTRGASGGAGVYILDLGGWKSEIAPYWAVSRGYGGAL